MAGEISAIGFSLGIIAFKLKHMAGANTELSESLQAKAMRLMEIAQEVSRLEFARTMGTIIARAMGEFRQGGS